MLKKFLLIFVLVGLLSACGGGSDETNNDSNAGSTVQFDDPAAEAEKSMEEKGLELLRQQTDSFDQVPDESILATGKALCASLDKGSSIEDVAWDAIEVYGPDAGALVSLAVLIQCPEYESDLNAWTSGSTAS